MGCLVRMCLIMLDVGAWEKLSWCLHMVHSVIFLSDERRIYFQQKLFSSHRAKKKKDTKKYDAQNQRMRRTVDYLNNLRNLNASWEIKIFYYGPKDVDQGSKLIECEMYKNQWIVFKERVLRRTANGQNSFQNSKMTEWCPEQRQSKNARKFLLVTDFNIRPKVSQNTCTIIIITVHYSILQVGPIPPPSLLSLPASLLQRKPPHTHTHPHYFIISNCKCNQKRS